MEEVIASMYDYCRAFDYEGGKAIPYTNVHANESADTRDGPGEIPLHACSRFFQEA